MSYLMKLNTQIDARINARLHRVVGVISKSLLLEQLKKIYAAPDFQPNMSVLWNFSCADLTPLTIEDIEEIASFVKEHWTPTELYKSALVAPEIFSNMLSKKFAKLFDTHAVTIVKVFKHEREAIDWLG